MPVINVGIQVEQEGEGGMEARETLDGGVKGVEGGGEGKVEELLGREPAGGEVVVRLLWSFCAKPGCSAVEGYG